MRVSFVPFGSTPATSGSCRSRERSSPAGPAACRSWSRARDGELRAFLNVCRHRGFPVASGDGRRETLQCPYHAWTYGLDGSLRAAPRSDEDPAFCKEELGLVPAAVGAWGPFVFVNAGPEPEPLADALGSMPAQVAELGLDGELPRSQFHFLWPNLTVNIFPGRPNISIGPVVPLTPERSYRFLDYFFGPDVDQAWIDDLMAFDDQVGREDRALVEGVQRGVTSGALEHGHLMSRSEQLIGHFQQLTAAALAD